MWRRFRHGEGDGFGLAGKELVIAIDQIDANLVGARGQVLDVDCPGIARVCPMPRQVINVDVQMADTRKHVHSSGAEDRHDVHVLSSVLDENDTDGECLGVGGIDDELSRWLFPDGMKGVLPRRSCALCAKALAVITVAASVAASVLARVFIFVSPLIQFAVVG